MTKYLFTMVKKEHNTNVGCVAITFDKDNKISNTKYIIDIFPSDNLKDEIFKKWSWASTLSEENKQWVSSKTNLSIEENKIKDNLIAKVSNYREDSFLDYRLIDLLHNFKNDNGRDATSFEINFIVVKHIERIFSYFKQYPEKRRFVNFVTDINSMYSHTGDNLTLEDLEKIYQKYNNN